MFRKAVVAVLVAFTPPALAETATQFDGSIVECESGDSYRVMGGRQRMIFRFVGEGRVAVSFESGELECEDDNPGVLRIGGRWVFDRECERRLSFADGGYTEIFVTNSGSLEVLVDGARIHGESESNWEVAIDAARFHEALVGRFEVTCDGESCAGSLSARDSDGGELSDTLSCDVRPAVPA